MSERDQQSPAPASTKRMDPGWKAKWLAALRSGKYKQADGVLKDAFGCHCCLGVLADVADPSRWSQQLLESEEAGQDCYSYDGAETMLFGCFLASVGLNTGTAVDLAGMNDDGNSFRQIADYIEENL